MLPSHTEATPAVERPEKMGGGSLNARLLLPDGQIDSLKQMLRQTDFKVEVSHETFRQGKKVGIINGPLLGLTGELKKEHGNNRFILRIDAINTVFLADVPAENLTGLPDDN